MAYILFKHDGIVERYDYSKENLKMLKSKFVKCRTKDGKLVSPCASCDNCYADKCKKIADKHYDNIKNYPFIDFGIEVVETINGKRTGVEMFIDKCDNYVIDHPRKKLTQQAPLREVRVKQFSFGINDTRTIYEEAGITKKKVR